MTMQSYVWTSLLITVAAALFYWLLNWWLHRAKKYPVEFKGWKGFLRWGKLLRWNMMLVAVFVLVIQFAVMPEQVKHRVEVSNTSLSKIFL